MPSVVDRRDSPTHEEDSLDVAHHPCQLFLLELECRDGHTELLALHNVCNRIIIHAHRDAHRDPRHNETRMHEYLRRTLDKVCRLREEILLRDEHVVEVDLTILHDSQRKFMLNYLRCHAIRFHVNDEPLYFLILYVTRPYHADVTVTVTDPTLVTVQQPTA